MQNHYRTYRDETDDEVPTSTTFYGCRLLHISTSSDCSFCSEQFCEEIRDEAHLQELVEAAVGEVEAWAVSLRETDWSDPDRDLEAELPALASTIDGNTGEPVILDEDDHGSLVNEDGCVAISGWLTIYDDQSGREVMHALVPERRVIVRPTQAEEATL